MAKMVWFNKSTIEEYRAGAYEPVLGYQVHIGPEPIMARGDRDRALVVLRNFLSSNAVRSGFVLKTWDGDKGEETERAAFSPEGVESARRYIEARPTLFERCVELLKDF